MLTNCFRFAPRDSVPGLIAKICKYLKDHPGWSEEELEEQIKQFIGQTGVESFNGRTGAVVLNENDVNNLKIASAYFAEGDETIDELDIVELYNQGVRFVFTNWNSVTSGYDLSFVLDYFSGSNDVVYYPMSTGSGGGGNIVSVNGKTGIVELSLSDILGDSGAQVKLCTATEFMSNTIATWNAYYKNGYRLVCVVNDEYTAVDSMYVLKQDVNSHQPIMILSGSGESAVTSVNTMTGAVQIPVVDVAEGDSHDAFAKIFINEDEDYPVVPSYDSNRLGGQLPSHYATYELVSQLSQQKVDKSNVANNFTTTDEGFVADARALKALNDKFYTHYNTPTSFSGCTYIAGGYAVLGNVVIVNLRVTATSTNFSVETLPAYNRQYSYNIVSCSIHNIAADKAATAAASIVRDGQLSVKEATSGVTYAISCVYVCD